MGQLAQKATMLRRWAKMLGGADGLVGAIRGLEAMEAEGRMMEVKRGCLEHAKAYSAEELFGRMCERIESKWGDGA